jgi:transposase|tara:strand:+ start:1315 stop:2376 length:1062 start_codon:yes stop_codon:yes gene_type:complete
MRGKHIDSEVILGVDTHLDIHVAAAINGAGILLGTRSISVSSTGYLDLIDWASSLGHIRRAGVEGTGTYGAALADALKGHGITVFEVNRSDRAKRRLQGKSDPTDAENAARAVLSGTATATPKNHSGACEAMRIASVARRSAVKARTQAINQIRALLVSAPQDVREKLWRVKAQDCVNACLRMRGLGITPHLSTLAVALKSIAKRWQFLSKEVAHLDAELDRLTRIHASKLRSRFGVGPNTAATLLSVAGDNPDRLKSEASLAALCGVNPLPASSGKTVRHRLNRGGSRAANNALWTIAMVRMRSDPRTRVYVQRRTGEGLSTKEIHRCLKRYIARELYPIITAELSELQAVS